MLFGQTAGAALRLLRRPVRLRGDRGDDPPGAGGRCVTHFSAPCCSRCCSRAAGGGGRTTRVRALPRKASTKQAMRRARGREQRWRLCHRRARRAGRCDDAAAPCLDCLKRARGLRAQGHRRRSASGRRPCLARGVAGLSGAHRRPGPGAAGEQRPAQAKAQLDEALQHDPQNAWALAALGGWNVEIVRGGGGDSWRDGSTAPVCRAGHGLLRRAFKVAPDNVVVRYQYSLVAGGLRSRPLPHRDRRCAARASHGVAGHRL